MTFHDDMQIDSSRASVGGGRGGKIALGGGAGGIILLVLGLVTGTIKPEDLTSMLGSGTSSDGSGAPQTQLENCKTGADANRDVNCRIVATALSLDSVWQVQLPEQTGDKYVEPGLKLFTGGVSTGCGAASSDVGPFYCPADNIAYFDSSFFQVLEDQFGSSDDPFAQEYVVAHEFGHHIQTQLGDIRKSQQDPRGAESGAVRTELQADCYAGIWAYWADKTPGPGTDAPYIKPLTKDQIAAALSAAESVGDDNIQERATGRVSPESFTHGSSEQRQAWFLSGYERGQIADCDTYNARDLDNP